MELIEFEDNPFFKKYKYSRKTTKLGEGSFGAVYQSSKSDGTPVAIKISNLNDINAFNIGLKEIPNLARLYDGCPNVVRYFEFHTDIDIKNSLYTIYLSMEYAKEGSLKDYLKKMKKPLSEEEVIKIIKDILQALTKMKELNIAHLDIKSANILCFPNNSDEICYKLADLAGAQKLALAGGMTNPTSKQLIYTQGYCAPGFMDNQNENSDFYYKADIFSLGITLLECCGIEPSTKLLTKSSYDEYCNKIKLDRYPRIKELLLGMIQFDATRRLSLEELSRKIEEILKNQSPYQNHPFFLKNKYLPNTMEFVGNGTFANVYKLYKDDKKKTLVALKISTSTRIDEFNYGLKEVANQVRLQDVSPNIVKCFDFYAESSQIKGQPNLNFKIFLSMEYAEEGSLKDYLRRNNNCLERDQIIKLAKDTLEALETMKNCKMTHLDIKSANILCFPEDSGICFKLADWAGAQKLSQAGLSRISQRDFSFTSVYCAPEVERLNAIELETVDYYKADLFSIGITLWECCGIALPRNSWTKESLGNFAQNISRVRHQEFKDLLLKMIEFDPGQRISVEDAIQHLKHITSGRSNNLEINIGRQTGGRQTSGRQTIDRPLETESRKGDLELINPLVVSKTTQPAVKVHDHFQQTPAEEQYLKSFPDLKKIQDKLSLILDLRNKKKFGDSHLEYMADKLLSLNNLQQLALHFGNTAISDEGIGKLARSVTSMINLTQFRIYLSQTNTTKRSVKELAIAIREKEYLNNLKFEFEDVREFNDECMEILSKGFAEKKYLKNFYLTMRRNNKVTDASLNYLFIILNMMPNLEELSLGLGETEGITGDKVLELVKNIENLKALKTLTLGLSKRIPKGTKKDIQTNMKQNLPKVKYHQGE